MRILISLFAVVVAASNGWRVEFTSRANNVGVQLETACYGSDQHLTYIAVDYMQVDGGASGASFRRHNEVPKGSACAVVAFVFANDEKGDTFFGADPSGDYIIESSPYVDQK